MFLCSSQYYTKQFKKNWTKTRVSEPRGSSRSLPRARVHRLFSVWCAGLGLVAQSCLPLCDPWTVARQAPLSMGSLQAGILEWVAMPFSRGVFPTQGSNREMTDQLITHIIVIV